MRWVVIARRTLIGVLVAVVVALVGGYWYARPLLLTGTGYAAHNIFRQLARVPESKLLLTGTGYAAHNACALSTLADRAHAETDLPPNPLVPYLRTTAEADGTATSSVFGLLATQHAWALKSGCTVADDLPVGIAVPAPIDSAGNPFTNAAAPAETPELTTLLDAAFGQDLPVAQREALGTRAVVVVKDGAIVAERYADGFDASTRQLGWSMTKSVTSLLVGRAVLEDHVDVNEPGLEPTWTDVRGQISMDELMRMTSGLAWDETYDLGTPITRMLYLEPDMPAYVAAQPSVATPGDVQLYSSGSTTLLCSVLAQRTGRTPSTMPADLLFRPLGLSSAVLETDAVGNPVCSSYLWATPRDWAAIGQFALQEGRWNGRELLPAGWMAQSLALKPVTSSDEEAYAAGWRVNTKLDGTLVDPRLPGDAYWAQGHDGQRLYVVPSQHLVVLRMGFSPTVSGDELRVVPLVAALTAGSDQ